MREREIIERERARRERCNQRYLSTRAKELALFPFVLLSFILALIHLWVPLQRGPATKALYYFRGRHPWCIFLTRWSQFWNPPRPKFYRTSSVLLGFLAGLIFICVNGVLRRHVEVGSSSKEPDFELFARVGRRGGILSFSRA